MMPEKFKEEYSDLLSKYSEEVRHTVLQFEENLIIEFKKKYNLSKNQITLLEGEPPF